MNLPAEGAMPTQEQPVFGLGMSGFSPSERKVIETLIPARPGRPGWQVCAFPDADAWCINGARLRVLPDGNLRVAAGQPSETALRLNLQDVDRPIAFATPLPDDFEPHWHFDPLSGGSIEAVLLQFDAWLWRARAQFVLGAQILESAGHLTSGVFHVHHEGRLLAVLDFGQGKAAHLPRVHPSTLWEARWDRRPASACDLPSNFVRTTPAELAWTYAWHTERNVLPARYRQRTVHYRGPPRVPLRMLHNSQLQLLGELSSRAASLEELERRTALPMARIERDMACLYYANAVTTDPRRAATAGNGFKGAPVSVTPSEPGDESTWERSSTPASASVFSAPTTPVMLGPRPDPTTFQL